MKDGRIALLLAASLLAITALPRGIPAYVPAIADAIRDAEQILCRIDREWPRRTNNRAKHVVAGIDMEYSLPSNGCA